MFLNFFLCKPNRSKLVYLTCIQRRWWKRASRARSKNALLTGLLSGSSEFNFFKTNIRSNCNHWSVDRVIFAEVYWKKGSFWVKVPLIIGTHFYTHSMAKGMCFYIVTCRRCRYCVYQYFLLRLKVIFTWILSIASFHVLCVYHCGKSKIPHYVFSGPNISSARGTPTEHSWRIGDQAMSVSIPSKTYHGKRKERDRRTSTL